jgi:hypothetical protein
MDGLSSEDDMLLDEKASKVLSESAQWGKYYLILLLISLLIQPFIQYGIAQKTSAVNMSQFIFQQFLGYVFAAFFVAYPLYKFYEFVEDTPKGIRLKSQASFENGIGGLKSSIKYAGIFLIVLLALYGLLILFGVLYFIYQDTLR